MTDYYVTVCASCLTASCWHGEHMCDNARGSDLCDKKASELDALRREHPDNYTREKLRCVNGREPEDAP